MFGSRLITRLTSRLRLMMRQLKGIRDLVRCAMPQSSKRSMSKSSDDDTRRLKINRQKKKWYHDVVMSDPEYHAYRKGQMRNTHLLEKQRRADDPDYKQEKLAHLAAQKRAQRARKAAAVQEVSCLSTLALLRCCC